MARAAGEYLLGRSLRVGDRAPVDRRVNGGHSTPFGRERNFAHPWFACVEGTWIEARLDRSDDERALGRITIDLRSTVAGHQPCVGGEDTRRQQRADAVWRVDRGAGFEDLPLRVVPAAGDVEEPPIDIELPDGHLVARQRAGLVGTDHRCTAQGFDNRQAAHERIPPDHASHADRQGDRDHRRQRLGDDRDRQGDAEHEHLDDRQAAQQTDGDNQADDHQCRLAQRPTEPIEVLLQRCAGDFDGLHHSGHAPELGGHAGRDDRSLAAAVADHRARVGHISTVAEWQLWILERIDRLLRGLRFACQCRLVDGKVDRLRQPDVGGYTIARP